MKTLSRKSTKGFTLLEMMVVLVLVSLITVLLMQGFGFVVGLQDRIRQQLVQIQDLELREQWFRIVVRSLHRGRTSDQSTFTGDPTQISGLTLQPLSSDTGLPTKVQWILENDGTDSVLTYIEENNEPIALMRWTTEAPEFRYMDSTGTLNETWPPDAADSSLPFGLFQTQSTEVLPKGIVLFDSSEQTRLFWYVSISSNTLADVDYAL